MYKQANSKTTSTVKGKKTSNTNRKKLNRFKPSQSLTSTAVWHAGTQVTNRLDQALRSTTELLIEKQLSIDSKFHGISKLEMTPALIPQNVKIAPWLAFQDVLKTNPETINNIDRLETAAAAFRLATKTIQINQSKLELEHLKEELRILFCKKFQKISKGLLGYIQHHFDNANLDGLPQNLAAGAALHNSVVHLDSNDNEICKYLYSTKKYTLELIINATLKINQGTQMVSNEILQSMTNNIKEKVNTIHKKM